MRVVLQMGWPYRDEFMNIWLAKMFSDSAKTKSMSGKKLYFVQLHTCISCTGVSIVLTVREYPM